MLDAIMARLLESRPDMRQRLRQAIRDGRAGLYKQQVQTRAWNALSQENLAARYREYRSLTHSAGGNVLPESEWTQKERAILEMYAHINAYWRKQRGL